MNNALYYHLGVRMLKPSLRSRYRYVQFVVIGPEKDKINDVGKSVYHEITRLLGVFGVSEMGITVMEKDDLFFVRVKREYLNVLRGVMPLINRIGKHKARPKIVKTSGTIKKLLKNAKKTNGID